MTVTKSRFAPKRSTAPAAKSRKPDRPYAGRSAGGPFVRIDHKEGRMVLWQDNKEVWSGETLLLHLDLFNLKAAWWQQSRGPYKAVQDEYEPEPAGAFETDGPRWGFEIKVASPYPVEGTSEGDLDGVPAGSTHVTALAGTTALTELWDAAEEACPDCDKIVVAEIAEWIPTGQGNRKNHAPRWELVGFADALETPLDFEAEEAAPDAD